MIIQANVPQLDLVCSGSSSTILNGRSLGTDTFRNRYHFDFEKSTWCIGACETIRDLYDVTPTTIEFHVNTEAGTNAFRIDRLTGVLTSVWIEAPGSMPMTSVGRGRCVVAPDIEPSAQTRLF